MAKDKRTPPQKRKPPAPAATKNLQLLYQTKKIRATHSLKRHATQDDCNPNLAP
jgi:hypothetical protein